MAPFVNHLTGNAIAKINHGNSMITLRLKLHKNMSVIDMINMSDKPMHFSPKTKP